MGNDFRLPSNFLGNMSYGTDFLQMQSMLGTGGFGGYGASSLGTDFDFGLFGNMLQSLYRPSISTTAASTAASTPLKPEERENKIKELDKTTVESEKEAQKAEVELTESKEAETALLKGKEEFSGSDAVGSVVKGAVGMIADLFCDKDAKGERHPSLGKTALAIGLGALAVATAPLTLPVVGVSIGTVLAVAGGGYSAYQVAKGASVLNNAKTRADKDAAVQEMTQGAIGGAMTFFGYGAAKALQAAKTLKTAETLTGATKGLSIVANEAGKASTVTEVINAKGLSDNAKLVKLASDARKAGKPITVSDLFGIGFKDAKQNFALHEELNAALKASETAGATTQDTGVISAINREIRFLQAAGTDSKAAKNAKESLSALLKLTSKDGITHETEAALARIKADYPEIAKELKLVVGRNAQGATVKDMAGREEGILAGLKNITGANEKEQAIIEKATGLLTNINKKGANRAELLATLKELQKCESVGGELEITILSARKALATTAGESLKATGRSMANSAFAIPGRVVGAAEKVVNVSKDEFMLNVNRTRTALPQAFNQLNESLRERAQLAQFAQVEKDIKDKKEAFAQATTKHEKAVRELSTLNGIDIKDKNGKSKSIEQLNKEIIIAKAGKEAAQKVLAEAEKEKAAKAAEIAQAA